MKFLGIDYGSKRVGVAVSDDTGSIAFPNVVLENKKDLINRIKKICEDFEIEGVVVGESMNQEGKPNPIHVASKSFAKDFEATSGLPIFWEPEFMTSHHATIGGRKGEFKKGILDAVAATLILQRFLDKKNN